MCKRHALFDYRNEEEDNKINSTNKSELKVNSTNKIELEDNKCDKSEMAATFEESTRMGIAQSQYHYGKITGDSKWIECARSQGLDIDDKHNTDWIFLIIRVV